MKGFNAYGGMEEDQFFCKLTDMFNFFNKRVKNVDLKEKDSYLIFILFIKLRRGMKPKKDMNKRKGSGEQRKRTQKERYENLYRRCRDAINGILKKYDYQPIVPDKKANGTGVHHIPAEIKVLVYYMAYRAIELYDHAKNKKSLKKPTQKMVLEFIGNPVMVNGRKKYQGYHFSDKTFTYFGISPSVFYDINNYKQITLPTSYAGAKVGYLGYCINYLTAFAGTVDSFVDLFGGSGSATMALMQQDTVEYYINELDFLVSNYHRVLNDVILYNGFIKELEKVTGKLKETNYNAEIGGDFFKTCEEKLKNWAKNYPANQTDTFSQNGVILSGNVTTWGSDSIENRTDAAVAYVYTHCFQITGGKSVKKAVDKSKLVKLCQYEKENYDLLHKKFKRLDGIYCADVFSQNNSMSIIEYFTDKAPNKFKAVEQVSKDLRNGVSFETVMDKIGDDKTAIELLRLLGCTKRKKPRPFRTLFYSDSPYLETSGYEAGGVNKQTMECLIGQLTDASKRGSHFIFSCRATRSVEDTTYSGIASVLRHTEEFERNEEGEVCLKLGVEYEDCGYYDKDLVISFFDAGQYMKKVSDLLKSNQSIYENLFKVFLAKAEEKNLKCHVLVCINKSAIKGVNCQYKKSENKKKLLETLDEQVGIMLQRLFVTEVFITDFDFIPPLDYKKYRFAKYTLEDFCNLLKRNLFRSTMYRNTIVKAQGDGYIFK